MLKIKLSKDITSSLINIGGELLDGGIVKYNAQAQNFNTILPDDTLNKESENVVKNKAISQKLEQIEKEIDDISVSAGKINSISVNGVKQPIDSEKNVNIEVPTDYATQNQVQTLDNKINTTNNNVTNLDTKINLVRQDLNNEIASNINKFSNIENDLSTINTNISTLSEGLQETDNKVTEIENDLDAHEQSAETQFQTINNKLVDLEGQIAQKGGIEVIIVDLLPTEDIKTNAIYFVPSITSTDKNFYYEYMYINNNWEMIGTTEVDLTDYVTKLEYNARKEEVNTAIQDLSSSLEETNDEVENIKDNLVEVVDDLNSTSTTNALSANQGKILNDKIKDIELFKFPNAVIMGEPTINNGQVSNFSVDNYMIFPFILDIGDRNFQIDFAFTTGSDVTTQQNILDSKFGIALAIANGKGLMAVSSNGTNWTGTSVGTINIAPNTTYYARLTWNKLIYKTALSTNGTDYTDDMQIVMAQRPYPRTIYIGGGNAEELERTPNVFKGIINMNRAYLTVGGTIVWEGMDDVGLATRADVSLSNLDIAGIQKIKDVISTEGYTKQVDLDEVYENINRIDNNFNNYSTTAQVQGMIDTAIGDIDTVLARLDTGSGV